jgi:hypothetical protein
MTARKVYMRVYVNTYMCALGNRPRYECVAWCRWVAEKASVERKHREAQSEYPGALLTFGACSQHVCLCMHQQMIQKVMFRWRRSMLPN